MLYWAGLFLVISIVAGALGFAGIAAGAARISKILFAVFLALALVLILIAAGIGALIF